LLFIWDISRLLWFAYPEQCPSIPLQQWRKTLKAKTWIYPAVDGAGPNGKLPTILADALTKFDRVLNYTEFSAKITGYPDVCPHGIDTRVFYPREDALMNVNRKFSLNMEKDEVLIGIVATNQPRKDWALAFGALAILNQQGVKARVWIHTDTDLRHWDLKAMYVDFGLAPNIKVFLTPYGISDDDLAMLYSACDVTLGIGPEGWGFPLQESLCCGTPVICGDYGGQADFVPKILRVHPIAHRYEGIFSIQRPVYNAEDFAFKISSTVGHPPNVGPVCSWDGVWPVWESWLKAGL
jgi:glycosyltransferase involved in cell wall biosynthesis